MLLSNHILIFSWNTQSKDLHNLLKEKQIEGIPDILALRIEADKLKELIKELQIKYIPTMLILYKKEIIDRFIGLPEERKLYEFYNTIQILYENDKTEREIKTLIQNATNLIKEGDPKEGIKIVKEVKKRNDLSNDYNGLLDSLLAKGYFRLGNITEAKQYLIKVIEYYKVAPKEEEAQEIVLELTKKFDSSEIQHLEESIIDKLSSELDKEPENNEKRYELALLSMKSGKYEECANQCMNIMRIERNWENGKAQRLLNEVLSIIGSSSELAIYIRKSLTSVLFT